ncbi:hypothetical protein LOD99_4954 [Oopsacas minuta]|uniref:Uncharacterized protein n=1 Tax=Oopsacas minuta TaxID=111878 RepID=A0AAV7JSM2_9METZ|nr:hypothetical protein LOD99_4954 [Oopsacas minuta]
MATHSSQTPLNTNHGFIVFDLETDGLIHKSGYGETMIPQILQIGFAPLEKLAHKMNVTSYYAQPMNPTEFLDKLSKTHMLQKYYIGYNYGYYSLKTGEKVKANPLRICIDNLIAWKKYYYKDQPVFLIAHHGIKFDKVVFEYNLNKLNLQDYFESKMNLVGWIDSLQLIRELPDILRELGYGLPREMTESEKWVIIKKNTPFSLSNLILALAKRYAELTAVQTKLEWPIFDLSLQRSKEEEEWQHYFTKESMIHSYRILISKLNPHNASDDVMALVCILHHLNLYPKIKKMVLEML